MSKIDLARIKKIVPTASGYDKQIEYAFDIGSKYPYSRTGRTRPCCVVTYGSLAGLAANKHGIFFWGTLITEAAGNKEDYICNLTEEEIDGMLVMARLEGIIA